jgi:hypothetical protein
MASLSMMATACSMQGAADSASGPSVNTAPTGPPFTLSGSITYEYVPAIQVGLSGGKIDYTQKATKPARRIVVQAISNGFVEGESSTDDNGDFVLPVPTGRAVQVRALAKVYSTNYTSDGIGSDNCNGSSWDVRVVDNTASRAQWSVTGSTSYQADTSSIALNAPLTFSSGTYSSRAAAPFAIADTVVSELEMVCQGQAAIAFPTVYINWSPNNVAATRNGSLDVANGYISTSFYSMTNAGHELYILGKANSDTDEYDSHVIAHEFGHYIESALFRSDSIGGSHGSGDSLDPRVAFGEGYGNALSGMTFKDPVYVDTSGTSQASGFNIDVSAAPTGDDRGHYSETSVQYFLWSLWDARDGSANSGSFDRIFNIMKNYQRLTPAFTSVQSFASYYNQVYGRSSEGLETLWSGTTNLGLPFDSLCAGTCPGSAATADPYDSDNDIGELFKSGVSTARKYPEGSTAYAKAFWTLAPLLVSGTQGGTAHETMVSDGSTYPYNKLGYVRWYRYVGTGAAVTIRVTSPVSSAGGCSTADLMDMAVYHKGDLITSDEAASGSTAGCPAVSFQATSGEVYMIEIDGFYSVTSFNIQVTP